MSIELSIGKLAEAAHVNIETIRYYQRRGLLAEPAKPLRGHRRYSSTQTKRVLFIKRSQALGFTLKEVEALLSLDTAEAWDTAEACSETQMLATKKLLLIEQKIADLVAMRDVLGRLVRQCSDAAGNPSCPIIDVLTRD